ncbi:MAG: Photosystem I assembly protein Ycf3 [Turneriella sp.]|nr:Photosystem I assembly protein Ycf3 [Turneriella sp.]
MRINHNFSFTQRLFVLLLFAGALGAQAQKESSRSLAAEVDKLNWEGIDLSNDARYSQAAERFQKAITLDDTRAARSYHNIGYTYELAGDKNKALDSYQKAVARNPQQTITWQSLGKLQYQMGLYKDAVMSGENVLKLDPKNVPVQKWLPDAYAKLAEQKMYDARNDLSGTPEDNPNCEARPDVIAEIGAHFTAIGVIDKRATALSYYQPQGLARSVAGMYAEFHPLRELSFRLDGKTPYFGVLQPNFFAGQENIEVQYNFKKFFFGAGILFTQLNIDNSIVPGETTSFVQNTEYTTLSDTKFGLFIGSQDALTYFALKVYPRYLFRGPISGPKGNSLDTVKIDLEYRHNLRLSLGSTIDENQPISKGPFTDFIFKVSIDEIYLTEFKPVSGTDALGHYFGTYDISMGMEFGKLQRAFDKIGFTYGFLLTERLYFQNIMNTDTTSFGNGQGYFGFNTQDLTSGNPFSSFRNSSFIITLFSAQMFRNRYILREKIFFESTPGNERSHALGVQIAFGLRF